MDASGRHRIAIPAYYEVANASESLIIKHPNQFKIHYLKDLAF
jgi:phosphatidate phosphatase PAH1